MVVTNRRPARRSLVDRGTAAVVLAAGRSSRMGRSKPLLELGGRTLLDRALDSLRSAGVRSIVVVLGDRAAAVRRGADLRGTTVIENTAYRDGMSTSLRVGVAALPADAERVLVVLGDQPFVSPETIRALATRAAQGDGSIFLPTFHGVWGNPVLFDVRLAPELDRLEGDVGCRGMFPHHPKEMREVEVDDPGILVDIDTPEELQRIAATVDAGTPVRPLLEEVAAPRVALHVAPSDRPAPRRLAQRPTADGPRSRGGGTAERAGVARSGRTAKISTEPSRPSLLIVGNSPLAASLATIGPALGFRTILVAPGAERRDLPDADVFVGDLDALAPHLTPTTYAVVASMGQYDEAALARIARGPTAYVGLVASRKRASSVFAAVLEDGVTAVDLARVRSPVGLDIGASTPEEIALSILAEIVKVRRTVSPGPAAASASDSA
jgi:molybdenum cofactor cytidylyltransferase